MKISITMVVFFLALGGNSAGPVLIEAQARFQNNNSLSRQVPVLCYHQIRDWKVRDTRLTKPYITPTDSFKSQVDMLYKEGYRAISADQLVDHLRTGSSLPDKPILFTFDDGSACEYLNGLPVLDGYNFKAMFFIVTSYTGRPGYMSAEQIHLLHKNGHEIGCHTLDHKLMTTFSQSDWIPEINEANAQLQQITGKPVRYFAYPYGAWNQEALRHVIAGGYIAAFQLSNQEDKSSPLFTIRRISVDGQWSSAKLLEEIKRNFK